MALVSERVCKHSETENLKPAAFDQIAKGSGIVEIVVPVRTTGAYRFLGAQRHLQRHFNIVGMTNPRDLGQKRPLMLDMLEHMDCGTEVVCVVGRIERSRGMARLLLSPPLP